MRDRYVRICGHVWAVTIFACEIDFVWGSVLGSPTWLSDITDLCSRGSLPRGFLPFRLSALVASTLAALCPHGSLPCHLFL